MSRYRATVDVWVETSDNRQAKRIVANAMQASGLEWRRAPLSDAVKAKRYDHIVTILQYEDGGDIELQSCADAIQEISLIVAGTYDDREPAWQERDEDETDDGTAEGHCTVCGCDLHDGKCPEGCEQTEETE